MTVIWTTEQAQQAEKKRRSMLFVFCALSACFLAAVLLLLFLSAEQYAVNLTANILLTVAYGWYAVWFLNVAYRDARMRCKLCRSMANALPQKEYLVFCGEGAPRSYQGVEMYELHFADQSGNPRQVMSFAPADLAPATYLVCTSANVLTACCEVTDEEI